MFGYVGRIDQFAFINMESGFVEQIPGSVSRYQHCKWLNSVKESVLTSCLRCVSRFGILSKQKT